MKTKTYLQIAEPCHENWDAMSPVEQGRYCSSCCKQVIDFTMMSDNEILAVLNKSSGNTCGRLTHGQLDRPMVKEVPYLLQPYKYILPALLPAMVITGVANAQGKLSKVNVDSVEQSSITLLGYTVYRQQIGGHLNGSVKFENGDPAAGVSVTIAGTKQGTTTDRNGRFALNDIAKRTIKLQLAYVGYQSKIVDVDLSKQAEIEIKLNDKDRTLSGEVVVLGGLISRHTIDDDEDEPVIEQVSRKVKLTGRVVDANGQPLPNATISCGKKQVMADETGSFNMKVRRTDDQVLLTATYAGYQPTSRPVPVNTNDEIVLTLAEPKQLDSVTVVGYGVKSLQGFVGGISMVRSVSMADTAKAMACKLFKNEMIKVYPNPVAAGQQVQIAFKNPGEYSVHLFDNAGKLIQSQKLMATVKGQVLSIPVPAGLAQGIYYIKTIEAKSRSTYSDKLIVR